MPVLGHDKSYAAMANNALSEAVSNLLRHFCKRPHLAVIMGVREADGSFTRVIGFQYGVKAEWEANYEAIALGKAELTARHNMDSRQIQLMHPELLNMGCDIETSDTKYWGSAILGNLVVACSGVEPYFDEAFSYMIVHLWRAMIQHALDDPDIGRRTGDNPFF